MTTTTDASTQAAPPAYQAWRRATKGRWLVVAQGETERACWERLCKVLDRDARRPDWMTLPLGQEP